MSLVKTALCAGVMLLVCLVLTPPAAQAGLTDDLKTFGKSFKKDMKQAGQQLGIVDKEKPAPEKSASDKAGKLPGGVSSRLKKAEKELDKAEKALAKGAGAQADRAKRARGHLKRAQGYRDEIDKRYQGKFAKDHPQVKAVDQRIKTAGQAINKPAHAEPAAAAEPASAGAGQAKQEPPASAKEEAASSPLAAKLPAAVTNRLKRAERELDKVERVLANQTISAEARAKQAGYNLKSAESYLEEIDKRYPKEAPHSHPGMKPTLERYQAVAAKVGHADGQAAQAQAQKDTAKQAKAQAAANSEQWEAKLKPFITDGSGKAFFPYATDEQKEWDKWNATWAELEPLWKEYQAADFPQGKSPGLKSTEKQLARFVERYQSLAAKRKDKQQAAAALRGDIVFSKEPIDPASPKDLTKSFQAGDNIYALIRV